MNGIIAILTKIAGLCRRVPLLPIIVLAAIPLALLGDYRPWGELPGWPVNPSLGQWIVIALVLYTVADTVKGMIDDIRHGKVGVDLLAVVAILSTLLVQAYWASWAVTLMIASGEAIEEYAQGKAESSLTALMKAAPDTAHVVNLPGVSSSTQEAHRSDGGWRHTSAAALHLPPVSAAGDGRPKTGEPARAPRNGEDCVLTGRNPEQCAQAIAKSEDKAVAAAAAAAHFNTVSVDKVRLGDVIVVLPGETVPVDGELLSGSATLDLSNINGEPVPREVYAGARVMSGAINGATTLAMRATQLARDSQYQRILELVSSARESRAAVVRTADILAVPFTLIAFAIAGVAWAASDDPTRFAQVLVIATPCPLLIAAPVAYIAGTGRLAKAGVLIKAQEVLENLGRVSHMFFDKTGTLTVKKPQVVRVDIVDGERLNNDHILMFAGLIESYSVHILAQGIAKAGADALARMQQRFAQGQRACPEPEANWPGHGREYPVIKGVSEDSGNGVSGEVNGHSVRVGRFGFVTAGDDGFVATSPVAQAHVSADRAASAPQSLFPPLRTGEMATFVSIDGRLVARIVLKDVARANAKAAISRLRELGIAHLSMLTGDKAASANIIAEEVGIDDVRAELFPEDKLAAVKEASAGEMASQPWWDKLVQRLTGESLTRPVTMMVGDGVNDAPVLACADIGMAITDGTSTAASESAQVVIMNDDIAAVPRAIAISRRTKRVMLQAVVGGLALSIIAMVCAAFNLIPVVAGAFLQEGIDVVSILWALTALRDRK